MLAVLARDPPTTAAAVLPSHVLFLDMTTCKTDRWTTTRPLPHANNQVNRLILQRESEAPRLELPGGWEAVYRSSFLSENRCTILTPVQNFKHFDI